jgi:hypothetical protein
MCSFWNKVLDNLGNSDSDSGSAKANSGPTFVLAFRSGALAFARAKVAVCVAKFVVNSCRSFNHWNWPNDYDVQK